MMELKPCPCCKRTNLFLNRVYVGGRIAYYYVVCNDCGYDGGHCVRKKDAIEEWNRRANDDPQDVRELPSVERKKGKWIWDDEGYHYSECWFHAHGNTLECMDGTYRFCPNCGAEMVGE